MASDQIRQKAIEASRQIVSTGDGQDLIYVAKMLEIQQYAVDTAPDAGDYPFLAAESNARGVTMAEQAASWQGTISEWIQLAATMEARQVVAGLAIEAAASAAEVDQALASFTIVDLLQGD